MTDIGKFRKTLEDMILQFRKWYKEGSITREQVMAIDKFEYKLDAGMKINPRGSIALFVDSIREYANEILSDNDQFFMENDIEIESEFIELSDQIRSWWPDLIETNKDYIRKRIKLLVMLGAIVTKDEPLRKIINTFRDVDNPLVY